MRNHRAFVSTAILVTTLSGSGTVAFAQEYRGTSQQQMACTPDVFRLCGAAIPDVSRIVACLQANTLQLSAPCRAVFESSESAPAPNPRQAMRPPVPRGYDYQYPYQDQYHYRNPYQYQYQYQDQY
jgi:hypothetical protein